MSPRVLFVQMNEVDVGRIERDRHGRPVLHYDDAWRTSVRAVPLSLSLPLSAGQHRKALEPYLWGLLPDNELILDAWAARLHTSARSAMGLLAHVGADCPGAVQLLTEDTRRDRGVDDIVWLSERELAERLRKLRADSSLWREGDDAGQFSLGGAQAKTALVRDGLRRWGIPSGRIPTTHIFKPGMRELAGHAENEHFCLSLVRELGLPAALSTVEHFEDQTAIVVQRYDRARVEGSVVRIHQEDLCQATGTSPASKYQNEGGPGASAIIEVLQTHSANTQEDVTTFIDALVISWVIVATDAHAKNYSVLHAPGRVRLAPLYDIASILPYAEAQLRRVKLAMSIGGKYRVNEIRTPEWLRLAAELGIEADRVRASLARILGAMPDAVDTVRKAVRRDGIRHTVVKKLADTITRRARALAHVITAKASS
jgi:serine/threonine-protein kinase HipA